MNKYEIASYQKQIELCQEFVKRVQIGLERWENEEPNWGRLAMLKSQEYNLANLIFDLSGLTEEEQQKYRI